MRFKGILRGFLFQVAETTEVAMALLSRGFSLGFPLPFFFTLLLGAATSAQAGEFCTGEPFFGVVDGEAGYTIPTQFTIDNDCTFQNFSVSNPLAATLNFQTTDSSIYLIVFDNVWYDRNLACSNTPHKLWVVNTEEGSFSGTCQDIMIPAETIARQSPAATATMGAIALVPTSEVSLEDIPSTKPEHTPIYHPGSCLWGVVRVRVVGMAFSCCSMGWV